MKKLIIKLVTFVLIFLITLVVASKLMNRGNTDLTASMSPATLPVIYMDVNDEYINPLHGYTVPMEGNYLRGSITPLMANREISFRADLYGAIIAGIGFEVRSMDMQRLIEDTAVTDFAYDGDGLYGTINLKDLIDDDTEYMLIIKLTTSSGNVIRYYARVINRAELAITEKMNFIRDFSEKTLDKEAALELKTYMESNSQGDNSSYGYVNIHSSFNQLTWGDLEPIVKTEKDLEILEIDGRTTSMMLTYQVEILGEIHNVTEFFRIRKGDDRIYLMEYERKMNQIFDEEKNVVVNGKILHGILNEKVQLAESDSGGVLCFVQQGSLFSYNPSSGVLAKIFSFNDKENDDARTRYNAHNIKPLSVDESGNIWFIVYGYMNRGFHEGEVGITMYYFNYALNTIEEQFFIPYTKSFQLLKQDIAGLSYINTRGNFYIFLDGTIYSVDTDNHTASIVQGNISEARFVSSEDKSVIAWQPGESISDYTEIKLLALDWTNSSSILAERDSIIVPLGFIDRDLVYGIARLEDLTKDDTGRTVVPMYSVRIQDINGSILKEYAYSNIYVTDVDISENQISMERLTKDEETGEYTEIAPDQIMNNDTSNTTLNLYSSVVTEETETTYQTILRREPQTKSPKLINPKEVVFEGSRNIILDNPDTLTRYYVYAKNEIDGVYTDAADAVVKAYGNYGVVVNKSCSYIWETENRKSKTQIEKIEVPDAQNASVDEGYDLADVATSDEEDIYAEDVLEGETFAGEEVYAEGATARRMYGLCLSAMLQGQDVYKDTLKLIQVDSITNILKENLEGMDVLDLTGCDLTAALYYVSRGYPVMVLCPNKEAVVIVGYDPKNTVLYNPMEGTIGKMGMNDSRKWFESNGNRYITYVPR